MSASVGDGPDAIVDPADTVAEIPTDDQVSLRLAQSLSNKLLARQSNLASHLIAESDPFVVALNAGELPWVRVLDPPIPYILRTVFPVGQLAVAVNPTTFELLYRYFTIRPGIVKSNGSIVEPNLFQDPRFAPISAVLYGASEPLNLLDTGPSMQHILVHNPLATNRLPLGVLPVAREYWLDSDAEQIRWT